jgi:hypothetical protein
LLTLYTSIEGLSNRLGRALDGHAGSYKTTLHFDGVMLTIADRRRIAVFWQSWDAKQYDTRSTGSDHCVMHSRYIR